jgi:hypothetical protein
MSVSLREVFTRVLGREVADEDELKSMMKKMNKASRESKGPLAEMMVRHENSVDQAHFWSFDAKTGDYSIGETDLERVIRVLRDDESYLLGATNGKN